MNNRERALNILHFKPADRMPAVHFGYWPELLCEWAEQGKIPRELAEGNYDNSPKDKELDKLIGWDFNWNSCVGTNNGLWPHFETKVLETLPDGSRRVQNHVGLIERIKPGVTSIPSEDDYLMKDREAFETLFKPRMQYVPERTNLDYYTHFTSPIRRYPDMMVHRLLTRYLEGGRSASKSKYEELCDHSSSMEQLAASAERASIKYKQVEYMADRMGIAYDAIISGVTEWGLYAEIIDNKCEGLIPMRDLDDDYYEFDERNYCLVGRRTHKRYALGDTIKVQVARCNLEKKQLDYALVE